MDDLFWFLEFDMQIISVNRQLDVMFVEWKKAGSIVTIG